MSTEYPLLDVQSIPLLVSSASHNSIIARVTPEIAKTILENCNFEKQRTINKRKYLELSSYMRDGTFQPFTTSVNFSVDGDKAILTDGQHRLSAIFNTRKTYPFNILITTVPAKDIYPVTDRGKPRSISDAIRSNNSPAIMGLSETATRKVAVGIKMIAHGYAVSQTKPAHFVSEKDVLSLMEDYKLEANRIFEMVYGLEYSSKLTGRLPMAILLSLYKKQHPLKHSRIDEFVYGCASNVGLGEGDVRRFVYRMYSSHVRGGDSITKASMSKTMETAILLTCWEYWYEGKTSLKSFSAKFLASRFRKSPNLAGTDVTFSGTAISPDD